MIKSIIKAINSINNSILIKKKYCVVPNTSATVFFLKKMLELNLIKNYKIHSTLIVVTLHFQKNKNLIKKIKNFYKPTNKIIIKSSSIEVLMSQKNKTLYFFFTNKNILNSYEMLKKQTGGVLLCKVIL